eukprot:scaffold330590_cov15-Prasinocladus_malaysianus.AAC.1
MAGDCGQVYWCSEACRDKHIVGAPDEPRGTGKVLTTSSPHGAVSRPRPGLNNASTIVKRSKSLQQGGKVLPAAATGLT